MRAFFLLPFPARFRQPRPERHSREGRACRDRRLGFEATKGTKATKAWGWEAAVLPHAKFAKCAKLFGPVAEVIDDGRALAHDRHCAVCGSFGREIQ